MPNVGKLCHNALNTVSDDDLCLPVVAYTMKDNSWDFTKA